MKPATKTATEEIEFPAQNSPLAILFVVVSLLTLVVTVYVLAKVKLPTYLFGPLVVVAGSCAVLAKLALEGLGAITLEITQQELVIKRMIGSSSYSWSDIESVKLFDPGATFANGGRGAEAYIGIGLFMRKADKKERDPSADPDVLVAAFTSAEADIVSKACNRLDLARRRSMNGGGNDAKRGPGLGKPVKGFRRPAAAA